MDYVISSHELFHDISTLFVGLFIPWVSDHCAIHYTIVSENDKILNDKTKTEKESAPVQFMWDQDSKEKFTKAFNDMGNEIKRIENLDIKDTKNILLLFSNTLIKAAYQSELKEKGIKRGNKKGFPWYDNDCIGAKNQLQKLSKTIKKNPR